MKLYNTSHLIVIVVACFIGCKSPTPDPEVSTTTSVLSENNLQKVREKCASMESMYSLLVAKDGDIVIEDYLHGKTAEDMIHVRSLSKGVLSILAGITIDKNLMSEDDFVSKYFTEENLHLANKVKISHLLNMTSGIEWDEDKERLCCMNKSSKKKHSYGLIAIGLSHLFTNRHTKACHYI